MQKVWNILLALLMGANMIYMVHLQQEYREIQQMASLAQIQALVEEIKSELPGLLNRSQIAPRQIVVGNGLSDISERLGLVQAGEFRVGNGMEPGFGFTGVRLGYPAFAYAGDTWHLAGVNDDSLEVGINAVNGKLYAGGGNVILDANGIVIQNQTDNGDPFMLFHNSNGTLLGQIYTNTLSNLELDAFGQSGLRKLILRSQIADGLVNVATIEVVADETGGYDYINASADDVYLTANRYVTLTAASALSNHAPTVYIGPGNTIAFFAPAVGGTTANYLRMYGGNGTTMYDTPSNPLNNGLVSQANIYIRNGKLVIQYNDAGTVRYKYLDLTGTGVTWTHTTSAP